MFTVHQVEIHTLWDPKIEKKKKKITLSLTNVLLIYEFVYFVGGIIKLHIWLEKNHTIPTGIPCSTDRI
jgi:hypothetical protein